MVYKYCLEKTSVAIKIRMDKESIENNYSF
jgi:hypothetical protein